MGWLDELRGTRIALDATPLIYYMEQHPRYFTLVKPLFEALDQGNVQAVASTVVLLEVLVLPIRQQNVQLVHDYRTILLHNDALMMIPVSAEIAEQAADLRSHHQVKTPDAIHLATGLHMQATSFITNDTRLPLIPGIKILSLDTLLGHND